jgi:hypothetical protein
VGLQPGTYTVTAERGGFKKFTVRGLVLQVDQNARVDVRFEVGAVTEIVEVTGQPALLQTEQSSVGAVVDRRKIVEFPLNGRDFVQLGLLLPGVNTGDDGSASGGGISVSGLRPEQNSFLLDGTTNSDQYQNYLVIRPSVDAIEEFKIQTSNYSAEFGKGAGGQINVVTRGGTNDAHGTVFEFNRNNAVQARNLFDRNPAFRTSDGRFKAPPFNQNQFGLTLGGPVELPRYTGKDRTFFFVNYEGFRLRSGNTTLTSVPTPEMKQGDYSSFLGASIGTDAGGLPVSRNAIYDARTSRLVNNVYVRDPFPGNRIPLNRFDPVALRAINYPGLIPNPNIEGSRGANGNPLQNYFDGRTRSSNYDLVSVRVDHQFSAKNTIMSRFSLTDSNAFAPNAFPGYGSLDNQRQIAGTLSYTRILGAASVNEFKFGYLRFTQYQAAENTIVGRNIVRELGMRGFSFADTPGLQGAPNFSVGGFATFGDGDGPYRPAATEPRPSPASTLRGAARTGGPASARRSRVQTGQQRHRTQPFVFVIPQVAGILDTRLMAQSDRKSIQQDDSDDVARKARQHLPIHRSGVVQSGPPLSEGGQRDPAEPDGDHARQHAARRLRFRQSELDRTAGLRQFRQHVREFRIGTTAPERTAGQRLFPGSAVHRVLRFPAG